MKLIYPSSPAEPVEESLVAEARTYNVTARVDRDGDIFVFVNNEPLEEDGTNDYVPQLEGEAGSILLNLSEFEAWANQVIEISNRIKES